MRVWPMLLTGAVCLSIAAIAAAEGQDLRVADAARRHDAKAIQTLLQQHVDVNQPLPDGATALHWAAQWDDLDTATALLRAGARSAVADDYGVTPLSLACTNGSAAMIRLLVEAGAPVDAALPTGETPLMTAARAGRPDAVVLLLDKGANINARENTRGQTALMWAAAERHTDVVRLLIARGADAHAQSTSGFSPLLFAARTGDRAVTQALLDAGVKVNEAAANGTTALVMATTAGRIELAGFLLDKGADPNLGPGFTPLHFVASRGGEASGEDAGGGGAGGLRGPAKIAFMRLLLSKGARVNARGPRAPGGIATVGATPFLLAAMATDVEAMRLLVEHGADPSLTTTANTTPLMVAAGIGQTPGETTIPEASALEAVKLCVELGNDVNAANAYGETAMHAAAYRGQEGGALIIQFLTDHGAKVNVSNQRGWTPLLIAEGLYFSASNTLSPSTVAKLKQLGADPSPRAYNRNTGLRSSEAWYEPGKEPATIGASGAPSARR